MMPTRVAPLVVLASLGLVSGAAAQMTVGAPTQPVPMMAPGQPLMMPPSGQAMAPPGASAPREAPCMAEFAPMRDEAQRRALAIRASAKRHASGTELCQLFTRFTDAEAKVVKYITDHHATCGIPAEVVTNVKSNHVKSVETRDKVCAGAAAAEARPHGAGLGEALGMRMLPDPETTSTGRGTLDTLTGNPLTR